MIIKWLFLLCTLVLLALSFNLIIKISSKMMYPPRQVRIRNAFISTAACVLFFSLTYFTW
ncbi:hypothetical protein C4B60_03250 [Jeotgalibacillus proteolyticus]|uniref:Uncharacterized protein n=1 Tax=Jeotgalibacillus proteolyticus TaxID=2082395 RepID=A0A2S5GHE3_9BACL|nr:hypothetical protein C4B60_03250 [Jeotgalibacillus proteolyticus]